MFLRIHDYRRTGHCDLKRLRPETSTTLDQVVALTGEMMGPDMRDRIHRYRDRVQ